MPEDPSEAGSRSRGLLLGIVAVGVAVVALMSRPGPSPLYILSGSFSSPDLYLFSFQAPASASDHGKLALVHRVPAKGPHQYLGLSPARDRVYATSWAWPPRLSAWKVGPSKSGAPDVILLNEAPITATSSYATVVDDVVMSVGGPTGEIHALEPGTGRLGEKVQEILYVAPEALEGEDKTRKALRYGSHAIEISSKDQVFVPHLSALPPSQRRTADELDSGDNAIHVYLYDRQKARLQHLAAAPSPRDHDGPRHVVVSADGNVVYSVTEHSPSPPFSHPYEVEIILAAQYVDVFTTTPDPPFLKPSSSHSLLPPSTDPASFRGDTIRLSPHSRTLYATTRGASPSTRGLLVAWSLDPAGLPIPDSTVRWETPTSGGKANAIELLPAAKGKRGGEEWIALTDDEAGWIFVVGYDPGRKQFREVARCRVSEQGGTSHAVWIG